MTPIRRAAMAAVALTAVLGLSACNNETVSGPPSSGGDTTSARGAASADARPNSPTSTPGETGNGSATTAPSQSSSGTPSSSQAPATTGSIKDKNAIPVERTGLPNGPVTDIGVKLLGGYTTNSSKWGEFYTVLDVTSAEPGLVDLQYVMLDKSGKTLKTVNDSIAVGGTTHEMKVTRASGALPPVSRGKVAKVRLKVVKNQANSFSTVTAIKPNSIKIGRDSSANTPTVSGQYRTKGKGSVISMNAVCVNDKGVVRSDRSTVDKIKAPTWTPFTVNMLSVKPGYHPTSCFVGS